MRRWVGVLVLPVALACGAASAAEQAPSAPTGAAPSGSAQEGEPKAIPLPQIASAAEETTARLRAIEAATLPLRTVVAIEQRLPDLEKNIASGTDETYRVLKENPSLSALDELLDPWSIARDQAKTWLDLLTQRAEIGRAHV